VQPDGGTWAPWPGPVRPLVPQGARQFRQGDRVQGTLVLLTGPAGERRVSGQGLTLQRVSPAAWWAQWAAVAGGAACLAALPQLLDRGLLKRWTDPTDARRIFVALTEDASKRMLAMLASAENAPII
jgi:hypothetical protein